MVLQTVLKSPVYNKVHILLKNYIQVNVNIRVEGIGTEENVKIIKRKHCAKIMKWEKNGGISVNTGWIEYKRVNTDV